MKNKMIEVPDEAIIRPDSKIMQVWLKCKQEVHYNKLVSLTYKEFDLLYLTRGDDISERANKREYDIIDKHFTPNDIINTSNEFKQVEVQLKK